MNRPATTNDFLTQLLAIQQDGRGAISAPSNWRSRPILEVPTALDSIIDTLLSTIIGSVSCRAEAKWHFFIGSPGNGKSSLIGRLYRSLGDHDCVMEDEDGLTLDQLADPSIRTLPYLMRIRHRSQRYSVAYVVQDASVARNPYATRSDPTEDLIQTVEEAWKRGICLIVCTNRGILESAIRKHYLNPLISGNQWFRVIRKLADAPTGVNNTINGRYDLKEHKNPVFETLTVSYSHLDNRSLLLNSNTFEEMIKFAAQESHWEVCDTCAVRSLCPYKANQEWLIQDEHRAQIVKLLCRAEVISGQVIVLREANALIALIFAGCTRDYGEAHPCIWVHRRVEMKDIFSIASRRVYMTLLCSWAPHGLEPSRRIQNRQLTALRELHERLRQVDQNETSSTLKHVIDRNHPSTDVGVQRLLGASGAFSRLDPGLDAVSSKFYELCDSDLSVFQGHVGPLFTEIERRYTDVWIQLYEFLEREPRSLAESQWAIKRWSSTFLMRFAALAQGLTASAKDLDTFVDLLRIQMKSDRSGSERRRLREGDRDIRTIIEAVADDGAVQLSQTVWLRGEWVRNRFGAKLAKRTSDRGAGCMALSLQFGDKVALLSAETYLCLRSVAHEGLHPLCASEVLLEGIKAARSDAAASSNYSFVEDGIEMTVNPSGEDQFVLTRTGNDVDVEGWGD